MKPILAFVGIITLALCMGFANASDFTMTSSVDCTGECNVKQSYNGESVEVVSSGKTSMITHADDGKAEMSINTTGQGEVRMNLNNGDDSNLKVSVGSEGSNENSSKNANDSSDAQKSFEDGSNDSEAYNRTCHGNDNDSVCSAQEGFGMPTHKTIEVNSDSTAETVETDGIFQKVYKFFESFTAKIFWG